MAAITRARRKSGPSSSLPADLSTTENARRARTVTRAVGRFLCGGSAQATGTGHNILKDLGARFVGINAICAYPVGTPDPQDPAGSRGLSVRGLTNEIWVNEQGERFHNEDLENRRPIGNCCPACADRAAHLGIFDDKERSSIQFLSNEWYGLPTAPNKDRIADFSTITEHAFGRQIRSLSSVQAFRSRQREFRRRSTGITQKPLTDQRMENLGL